MDGGRRRANGFTILHLVVVTAMAAYAFGLSLPAEQHWAAKERHVVSTANGMQALASGALSYHSEENRWPTDVCDLIDSPSGTNHLGAFGGVDCTAPPPHRALHSLGGDFRFIRRTSDESSSPLPRWRRDGLSIRARGIDDEHTRYALAGRLGHNSHVGAQMVSLEVPPFGSEASHEGVFAGLGTPSVPTARWTGDMRVGSFAAGPPVTFSAGVILAGADVAGTPNASPPLVGGVRSAGAVRVNRNAAFDRLPPNMVPWPPDPIERGSNSAAGSATVSGITFVTIGSAYVQCECGGWNATRCNPPNGIIPFPPDSNPLTPEFDPHWSCPARTPGLLMRASGDMRAADFIIQDGP